MRVFRFAVALWYDPQWWANRGKGWQQRRYWLAKPQAESVGGRGSAVQFGPVTLKFRWEGRTENG
jgi:hypothetical protein